jgi:hypothetical protein
VESYINYQKKISKGSFFVLLTEILKNISALKIIFFVILSILKQEQNIPFYKNYLKHFFFEIFRLLFSKKGSYVTFVTFLFCLEHYFDLKKKEKWTVC